VTDQAAHGPRGHTVTDEDRGWPSLVRKRLTEHVDATRRLLDDDASIELIVSMASALAQALTSGSKVLIFGNGGSAADAQHLASELVGRFLVDRRPLPALALADSGASVTAIGNDYDYQHVFARQVEALGAPGDVAIGLSTSGRSANVIEALRTARSMGLVTMALTGARDSPLAQVSDFCLRMPTSETPRIQECYMVAAHTMCELVEDAIVPADAV
jgi:D-sedoheptulose 7-phosphate isomerase